MSDSTRTPKIESEIDSDTLLHEKPDLKVRPDEPTVTTLKHTNSTWMASIPDDLNITQMTIPGTHQSCTFNTMVKSVECQSLSLKDQMESGIRFLDIGLKLKDNDLVVYHGHFPLRRDFNNVVDEVLAFLAQNPTETILMSIKDEADETSLEFAKAVNRCCNYNYAGSFLTSDSIRKFRDMRSKIVLLRRFEIPLGYPFLHGFGLNLFSNWQPNNKGFTFDIKSMIKSRNNFTAQVQDYYETSNSRKKYAVIAYMLNEARFGPENTLFLNFASASNEWAGMPDALGMALQINPQILEKLAIQKPETRFGIIPMDFPNQTNGLIENLISFNALSLPIRKPVPVLS